MTFGFGPCCCGGKPCTGCQGGRGPERLLIQASGSGTASACNDLLSPAYILDALPSNPDFPGRCEWNYLLPGGAGVVTFFIDTANFGSPIARATYIGNVSGPAGAAFQATISPPIDCASPIVLNQAFSIVANGACAGQEAFWPTCTVTPL